ncbi:fibrous sheath CABYR-binding protein-like [Rhodamnia argentea]|uniref:Fibrous sheath CABYR-binding protein-like n=1 Tax=Rhodamnia argentea TaxID=178133 RepID=A0A8B8R0Q4_9MYRT|nr:fibrous sheath CABYR-binding protein-like [Rhodamnia argentea]
MASVQVSGSPSEFEEIEAADTTKTEETIAGLEPTTDHDGEIPAEEAIEEADEVEAEEAPEEETKETNAKFTEEPAATPDEDENPLEEEEE